MIDTHGASAAIDHEQSRDVEIVTEPTPPAAPKDEGPLLTETWHLSVVGATTDVDDELQRAASIPHASAKATLERSFRAGIGPTDVRFPPNGPDARVWPLVPCGGKPAHLG